MSSEINDSADLWNRVKDAHSDFLNYRLEGVTDLTNRELAEQILNADRFLAAQADTPERKECLLRSIIDLADPGD